jgi:hypothetical protein
METIATAEAKEAEDANRKKKDGPTYEDDKSSQVEAGGSQVEASGENYDDLVS